MKNYTITITTEGEGRPDRQVRAASSDAAVEKLIKWLRSCDYDSDGVGDVQATGQVEYQGAVVASVTVTFTDAPAGGRMRVSRIDVE